MMRFFIQSFFVALSFIFIACSTDKFFSLFINDTIDSSLPIVSKIRVLADVTSVGFEWDLPHDINSINGYAIYRLNAKNEWERVGTVKNSLATHYYDKDLKPKSEYIYSVSTIGTNGNISKRSKKVIVKTSFIDPIDKLFASNNYARQIKLFWSPSANPSIEKYIIEREDNGKFVSIGTTNHRFNVEYFDENLADNKSMKYRVLSKSFEGAISLPSNVATGYTRSLPPSVLNIKATNDKPREIWITWDASSDKQVNSYKILHSIIPERDYEVLATVKGNSYIHRINEDGVTRFYKVVAVDNHNLESKSSIGIVVGKTLPPPPPTIINQNIIVINKNGTKSGFISWNKINDKRVVGYVIYKFDGNTTYEIKVRENEFRDDNLKIGITYMYSVSSVDKNDIKSSKSNQVKIRIPSVQTPINTK